MEAVMDDHTDAPGSPDTSSGPFLNLFGPPLCILVAGLIITALAEHQSETIAWAYSALISGFAALVCVLVTFRCHRQTRAAAAMRKELQGHNQQLSNMQTEKRILRQALNDSEQRSRDLVSLSGAIVFELDEHAKVGYVSAGVADVMGYAPANLAGGDVISLISECDHGAFNSTLKAARQDRQLQCIDLSLTNAEGQPAPVTLRVLALHDTLHGFSGFRLSMQPKPHQQ
jgi:PAS domain S-box-containing protein